MVLPAFPGLAHYLFQASHPASPGRFYKTMRWNRWNHAVFSWLVAGCWWSQPGQAKAQAKPHQGSLSAGLLSLSTLLLTLLAWPAQAANLQRWEFDANRNQLEFITDGGVQPRAQLLLNPTRLVIDLPGVIFGRPQTSRPVNSSTIRSLRVGQFDKETTRIVVELEPGYMIDPNQVQFRGVSPREWLVTLPQPQRVPGGSANSAGAAATRPLPAVAQTQIQGLRVTGDGLFVRTSGKEPQIQVSRSNDRRIDIDLLGTSISPSASPREMVVNKKGVQRAQISQLQATPPIARLTLSVAANSPDWQASYSNLGGVIVIPDLGGAASASRDQPTAQPGSSSSTPSGGIATIQAVEFDPQRQQLVIRGDRPITYTTGWDRSAGQYQITLTSAQLAKNLQGPRLRPNSPLLQVRLRQDSPQTVTILVLPAAGTQLGNILVTGRQAIALPIASSRRPPLLPPTGSIPIPVPPSARPLPTMPPAPRGRVVVVVDPGHGGPDPGAVGIGGIREKDIVLDIGTQVAAILERNGVQAILTRNSDIDLDLQPRVDMAERANATVFVSIHANAISMARPDVNGLEVYYYDSGLELAKTLKSSILQSVDVNDRGVRRARFFVLRRTSMPSVLVETGFVTGAQDAANLGRPAHRQRMAEAIARGILQYLQGRS
jgi:N-acetylmuramoyl-L-alanine amidase